MPEVSVVMSAYNAAAFIKEAIESILNQTYENFEFIIINDGSTDTTQSIIESYKDTRIKLINQENKGLSKSLNIGIRNAVGKYIARMDADDISMPDRLEKQYHFLEKNLNCVVVGTNAKFIDANGHYLYNSDFPLEWTDIKNKLPHSPFFHSSTMFLKDIFFKAGGYMEDVFHHFEDKILWNKMAVFGELRNIYEPLIYYRIVPSGISNRNKKIAVVMDEICNNIIKNGAISSSERKDLEKIAVANSAKKKVANYHFRIGKIYLEYNFNRSKAMKNLIISLFHHPFSYHAWFNLSLCFLPQKFIRKWKSYRIP